jgi:RNA polymerase sigma-70 factor (ECF subfamily)
VNKLNLNQAVVQAKAGDKEALLDLVMATQNEFYGLAFVYMRNEQDAADALQDMIVTLFTRIHTLKSHDAFYSWAKQILVRGCINKLRRLGRQGQMPEEEQGEADTKAEERLDLFEAVHQLPEEQRDVVLLFYYRDRTFEEIARVLNCPVGTVKSRLHQALKKLKRRLGDEYRRQA